VGGTRPLPFSKKKGEKGCLNAQPGNWEKIHATRTKRGARKKKMERGKEFVGLV